MYFVFFPITVCLYFDLVLAGLGWQGGLVQVVEVWVEQSLLGGDPLGGVVHQHLLEQVQPGRLDLLHAVLQAHCLPVGERSLRKNLHKI